MADYKANILVLDDDSEIQALLKTILAREGYAITSFVNPGEALNYLRKLEDGESNEFGDIDLILSDIRLPEMDGLTFVEEVKKVRPKVPIVLMTAYGSLENAVRAIRLGAYDFLAKPLRGPELTVCIERALKFQRLESENQVLREEIGKNWRLGEIIGKSPKMVAVFDLIKRVSQTTANVLINGESGTGKEVVARAIHNNSPRASKAFVALNCSAIPEALLESELFGHAKGSFTGALQNRRGLFQEAEGGTIFLDEIGDMSIALQAKLLRVLQDKKVKPVGENAYIQTDVRVVAATHRDLKNEIKKGRFREDLYYRLSVIPIVIPPLRERQGDIALLAKHFLRKFSATHCSPVKQFSRNAMTKLMANPWHGNVRELENLIERLVVLTSADEICEDEIPTPEVEIHQDFRHQTGTEFLSLRELEKRYVAFILSKTGGKKERAAQILKIDRKTLYRKALDYGLHSIGTDTGVEWAPNNPAILPATPPAISPPANSDTIN